jgi:hypothetical protein
MLILLVGPKGSGKSHIGRVLEERLGIHFFHVEPHWMAYHAECAASGRPVSIREGLERIRPELEEAFRHYSEVLIETTGASDEILDAFLATGAIHGLRLVRVTAPLALCLDRIVSRDPTDQIPMDDDRIRSVHAAAESVELPFDLEIENVDLTDDQIVGLFESSSAR